MPSEGKLEGENARKHKLLSINKTPNNTSSLHQMSGFFACARAVLYFFSCALYFETAALLCSTMTTRRRRREERGSPASLSKREYFFLIKGCFFSSFLPLCRSRRRDIFGDIFQRQKRAKKLSFASLSLLSWVQVSLKRARELQQQKFKKNEKKSSREKTKIISFPHNNLTNTLSLCSSARERWKR